MLNKSITRRGALGILGTTMALVACSGKETSEQKTVNKDVVATSAANDRVKSIMDAMDTRRKVEQMIVPSLRYVLYSKDGSTSSLTELVPKARDYLGEHAFGGVLLFEENLAGNEQATRLIDSIQEANAPDESTGRVPLLIATDQEGGAAHRIVNGCQLCGNMALGALGTEEDARQAASIMGKELAALGINCDFAPVIDINSNPNNPIIGVRSFGDSPQLVARLQSPFVQGLRDHGIVGCLKHFPGHGDTSTDSHTGLPRLDLSLEQLRERELIPFATAIEQGTDMMMVAHIQFPSIEKETYTGLDGTAINLPASLSKTLVTDVLRTELNFPGVISTDSLIMDAIEKNFAPQESARMAIEAGADILLEPVDPAQDLDSYFAALDNYVDAVVNLVERETIPAEYIDAAVTRILLLKFERNILDCRTNPLSLEDRVANAVQTVGCEAHHESELDIAKRAVTLVKNDGGTLPIQSEQSVVVLVGYESQATAAQYAVDRLVAQGTLPDASAITILSAHDATGIDTKLDNALQTCTVAIGVSTMYDADNLSDGRAKLIDSMLERCEELGIRSVVISAHLPYDLAHFNRADALLACYYGSGMKQAPSPSNKENVGWAPNLIAALCVALGDGAPEGTLPVTIPQGDMTLFANGTGLQY